MKLYDNDAYREEFIRIVYSLLRSDGTNDRANQIIEAFDMAPEIEADPLPPNAPLTLDELREMGFGEWVWIEALNVAPDANIVDGYYRKMDGYRPEDAFYFGYPEYEKPGHTAWVQYADYGKKWLAYRHRPEGTKP